MLDFVFIAIILVGLGCTLLQLVVMIDKSKYRFMLSPTPERLPAVSILKPLKGMDDQLEENLRTFFTLAYPKYELIFGVNDADDPAVAVAERLRRSYPEVPSRLEVSHLNIGLNPKVNLLQHLYEFASHDPILISDSNTRLEPDYLQKFVSHFVDGNYGLLTSTIRGVQGKSLGAIFENLHLNSMVVGTVLALERLFGMPISIGKSMLLQKKTLESIGGFRAFRNYLAEDYFMRSAVRSLGLRVSTVPLSVSTVNEFWSLQKFVNRHSRWAKMRRHVNVLHYFLEIFLNPVLAACLYVLLRPEMLAFLLLPMVLLAKIVMDGNMIRLMRCDLKSYHLLFIPIKDLLISAIWIMPYLSRKVNWRGNRLRISKQTQLVPVT